MFCRGSIVWSSDAGEPAEVWNGYTVFQVKHKQRLSGTPSQDAAWLRNQIRDELEAWASPASGRGPVPDYFVVVTNVPLTPVPRSGGLDTINQSIRTFIDDLADERYDDVTDRNGREAAMLRKTKHARMSKLRAWRVWDGNQVDTFLAAHGGVRRAFSAFLTASDVFAHLGEFTDKLPLDELEPALRKHARIGLMGERSIYFDEAGSALGMGTPIEKVAIDLPLAPGTDRPAGTVMRHVLGRGERVLKPSLNLFDGPRHIVIVGAPGNGKTTMSKFLVQIYRAAMLAGGSDLGQDLQEVISETDTSVRRLRRTSLPAHRRWPMRIDLAEYVEEGGLVEESTLVRWLAAKVSRRSNLGELTPRAVMSWLKQWPSFLVLDGLDEVTDPTTRKRLIARITEFVSEAESENCDLLTVVTTRPTGYVENIAPTQFERVDLARLSIGDAVAYGIRTTRIRLGHDQDKIDRVEKELRRAAESEPMRRMMQTPLQVLIMTIIVEGAGRLAPDRYSLFWGYYDTVFKREREKRGRFPRLLQDHAQHILELHQRVGFHLQLHAEESRGATATITLSELRDVGWQVLHDAGYKPSDVDASLLDEIVTAATHRLVLLAPRDDDSGLGFDVRSLQELMAARYLTTGTSSEVIHRLRIAAVSPHWRNTLLFAAGQWFSEPQPHQHEAIVSLVENLDSDASCRLGRVCPVGPFLALDLIDDGMARTQPRFNERLLTAGLKALHVPRLPDLLGVTRVLVRAAEMSDRSREQVADALRDALSDQSSQFTAQQVQDAIDAVTAESDAGIDIRALTQVKASRPVTEPPLYEDAWAEFEAWTAPTAASDRTTSSHLAAAAESIRNLRNRTKQPGVGSNDIAESIMHALRNPEAAPLLEEALVAIRPHELKMIARIRDTVVASLLRQPIGPTLRRKPTKP